MIDRRPITNALLQMLRDATARQIFDSVIPKGTVTPQGESWGLLHSIPGGGFDGAPMVSPDSDLALVYQVDSVGRRRDHAEWMGDTVRRTILARTVQGRFQVAFPDPPGVLINDRRPYGEVGGVDAEGDDPYRVYTVAERFVLFATPS